MPCSSCLHVLQTDYNIYKTSFTSIPSEVCNMAAGHPRQEMETSNAPTTRKDESEMDSVPSTSVDDKELTEEEKKQRDEIIAAIQNDPEAVRDEQVNKYLNEPVMIRESTSLCLPQVSNYNVERNLLLDYICVLIYCTFLGNTHYILWSTIPPTS